jgi:hypothetical protein
MMQTGRLSTVVSLSLLVAATTSPVGAVSLRPNKATDNTVCDLTHDTNAYLSSMVLVPAVASQKDQVDALYRLAAHFVASKCGNGQLLMLQGSSDVNVDAPSLTEVANSACSVATVVRTEIKRTVGERSKSGFELRCPIAKHEQLVQKLADLERADPMESLKARMQAAVLEEERGSASGTGSTAQGKKECNKMTLGSLLQGGACK